MPRKQDKRPYFKPASGYVHPSLKTSSIEQSASITKSALSSVSEQINHLRRTQSPRSASEHAAGSSSTASPAFELKISNARRQPAGPEPRSWSFHRLGRRGHSGISGNKLANLLFRADHLPGINVPGSSTLLNQILRQVAMNFEFHCDYDHMYLSTLPVELKSILLSYMATYSTPGSLNLRGLKYLFADNTEMEGTTEAADLERLDLGGSIGYKLTFKQLRKYWTRQNLEISQALPESWDLAVESPRQGPSLRFPSLTRLSLSRPSPDVSWSELLGFSRHLGRITHLSLAYWPMPRLPSRSNLAAASSACSERLTAATAADADAELWDEAAAILKHLSRNTTSLRWLNLEGCAHWSRALRPGISPSSSTSQSAARQRPLRAADTAFDAQPLDANSSPSLTQSADPGPEWNHSWRHITLLMLSQSTQPPAAVSSQTLTSLLSRRAHAAGASTQSGPSSLDSVDTPASPPDRSPHSSTSIFSLSRAGLDLDLGESYAVRAPNEGVAHAIATPYLCREWVAREIETLEAVQAIRRARAAHGGEWVQFGFDWGWSEVRRARDRELEMECSSGVLGM